MAEPSSPARSTAAYRRLDPVRLEATSRALAERVEGRFPGSGLGAVAAELLVIARESRGRLEEIARPNWGLRLLLGAGVALLAGILAVALGSLRVSTEVRQLADLVQAVEAAINDAVLLGLGLFFMLNLEGRLKRRKALAALHELRSMAHIVDMHQLTKDPELLLGRGVATIDGSPPRAMTRAELSRYLHYCSELLSLTGKLAGLHAQDLRDPVILSAVNDVEQLAVGLSRTVWQKIMILDEIAMRAGELGPEDAWDGD
jgi:hypothetical protein